MEGARKAAQSSGTDRRSVFGPLGTKGKWVYDGRKLTRSQLQGESGAQGRVTDHSPFDDTLYWLGYGCQD